MTSRELEIFHAVMCSRSLTEAASSLRISQPAMSKAIKRLEDRLRVRLFQRIRGRLRPTLEAESLLPEAARLMREMHGLSRTAMELRDGETGLLRVAASGSLGLTIMPMAMAAFAAAYPKVKLVSHHIGATAIADLIVANGIDIGMTLSPVSAPGTASQSLATIPMLCAMPVNHPLARHRVIRPRDLDGVPLISFGADSYFGRLLDEAFERDGTSRRITIELIMAVQAIPLVRGGAGIAIVDSYTRLAGDDGIVWRDFLPGVTLPVTIVTSTVRPASRIAQRFTEQLAKTVQTEGTPPCA